jgi:hypothetical protein
LPVVREYAGMKLRADTTQIPAEFMSTLDEAYRDVLKDALGLFGPSAHSLLTGVNITLVRGSSWERDGMQSTSQYVSIRMEPIGELGVWAQIADAYDARADILRAAVETWFMRAAHAQAPPAIRQWSSIFFAFRPPANSDYHTYRVVAYSPFRSSSSCLRGVNRACRSLFAIEPGGDTTASWLDPDERRGIVSRYGPQYWRRRTIDGVDAGVLGDRCVRAGIDAACRDVLRTINFASPLHSITRAELMRLAFERGGAEAFARFRSARSEDVGDIIETTAGVPLDSLLTEWRTRILAAKPQSPVPNSRELAVSALLVVCALAVSAGRRP